MCVCVCVWCVSRRNLPFRFAVSPIGGQVSPVSGRRRKRKYHKAGTEAAITYGGAFGNTPLVIFRPIRVLLPRGAPLPVAWGAWVGVEGGVTAAVVVALGSRGLVG